MKHRHSFWCLVLAGWGHLHAQLVKGEWSGMHEPSDESSEAGPAAGLQCGPIRALPCPSVICADCFT